MLQEYEGKVVQFYLKSNEAKIKDITGMVESVNAIPMPNGIVEVIFVLDTQEQVTYDIPYRNVAFMVVTRMESSAGVGQQSVEGKSLGMTVNPSQYAQNLIEKRSDQDEVVEDTTSDTTVEDTDLDEPAKTSLGTGRQPVRRVEEKSMKID